MHVAWHMQRSDNRQGISPIAEWIASAIHLCCCKPACKPTAPVALGIDCAHWVDVKDPYSVIRNSHQLLVSSSVQQVEKHIGVDETMHNETNVAESHASEQVTRGLLLPPS